MCQLCTIKDLAKRDRWPKPLEHHKRDIDFLVTSAHDEYSTYRSTQLNEQGNSKSTDSNNTKPTPPDSLLDILRLLATLLEEIESDRQKWWTSPEKREQRRALEEEGNQQKLSALHKINNDVNERIEAMSAKLGTFVKWSLGINGGIWELQQGHKVDRTGGKD